MNEDQMMGAGGQVQQQAQANSGAPQGKMPTVQEVAQMLMQGVKPQELVDAGIPIDLIKQAVALLEQQMQMQQGQGQDQGQDQQASAQPQQPDMGGGLAQSMVQ